ncbi:MAG: hypothetical protein QOK38_2073 [Acidobacteriaceae bacterium]|jgi:hypothetical protein|nr:hypothetical protein [Acidobacteriaceae bacterium]
MPVPQFLSDLLSLLYAIASPAAVLTLVAAGLSLRTEGGMNFHLTGRTGKWIMWTVILLTLPEILQWIGAQGVPIPGNPGSSSSGWISGVGTAFQSFVSLVLNNFVPVAAAFMVLKATLDAAGGDSPLPSIIAAIFLLSIKATKLMFQGWNSGSETATTDMLQQFWNYIAGTIMPSAAGLAVVGAVANFVQRRPYARLIFAAIGFLSLTGLFHLIQAMAA